MEQDTELQRFGVFPEHRSTNDAQREAGSQGNRDGGLWKSPTVKPAPKRVVHGDDLLYRFFRDLFDRDPVRAEELAQSLVEATAIWFPRDLYFDWPVLLPWVVRDPACRGNRRRGLPDMWSAPNADGFLRDDNSLIKALPRSLSVRGPSRGHLDGARIGTEFVASHVWRVVKHDDLASRLPLLNSFLPNLVWLPSQIAKLSDQEGSPLQRVLQAMSYSIYRHAAVADHVRAASEEAWALIAAPEVDVTVHEESLNWFVLTERFRSTRAARLKDVTNAFEALANGQSTVEKVVSNRYTNGLASLPASVCVAMTEYLRRFGVQ